jgi:hypothetical protein
MAGTMASSPRMTRTIRTIFFMGDLLSSGYSVIDTFKNRINGLDEDAVLLPERK